MNLPLVSSKSKTLYLVVATPRLKASDGRRSEAAALLGLEDCTAEEAALGLGPHCDIAVVTDGASGSCVSALGSLHVRL